MDRDVRRRDRRLLRGMPPTPTEAELANTCWAFSARPEDEIRRFVMSNKKLLQFFGDQTMLAILIAMVLAFLFIMMVSKEPPGRHQPSLTGPSARCAGSAT